MIIYFLGRTIESADVSELDKTDSKSVVLMDVWSSSPTIGI